MSALIILNGILPQQPLLDEILQKSSLIFCADGGANKACERGIIPDFIVGDFDSIDSDKQWPFSETTFIHRPDQNTTDFEKTLYTAIEKELERAIVIGFSGERFDHQLCNLNVMEKYCGKIDLQFIDDWGWGFFVGSSFEFCGRIGQQVSLHAMGKVEGITTSGLKFPLHNESLEWAVRDGQSNEIFDNPVQISVKSGKLFVFVCHIFK